MAPRSIIFLVPLAVLLLSSGCASPRNAGVRAELAYTVRVDFDSRRADVTAVLERPGGAAEAVRFAFGRGNTFLKLDEPLLEGPPRAFDGRGAALEVTAADPFTFDVAAEAKGAVRLEYTVPMRHRELDAVRTSHDSYEFPYLDKDHGMLTAWTLFLAPQGIEPERITVEFVHDPPVPVVVPWPRSAAREAAFEPPDVEALLGDLIAVGSWHTRTIRVGEFEALVAVAPGQQALEASAPDAIERIVTAELALFGRPPKGQYLFLFGRPDIRGAAGSPKLSSMTLAVEPRLAEAGRADFLCHLVAHEFFHTWAGALYHAPDELRWVNEGFTDYYAYLIPARLGIITWDGFARTLGTIIDRCAENAHRGALSLAGAGGEIFFRDREAYDLVYGGGLLVAAWLDGKIRQTGGGRTLDDFMRAFNNDPRWEKGRRAPALNDFFEILGGFVDPQTVAAARRLAEEPFSLDATALLEEAGLRVTLETAELGLDPRVNLEGAVAGALDPAGAASLLGVRQGDRFVEVNGRAVAESRDVLEAWQAPKDSKMRLVLERGAERVAIERELPLLVTRHAVDARDLAERLAPQGAP